LLKKKKKVIFSAAGKSMRLYKADDKWPYVMLLHRSHSRQAFQVWIKFISRQNIWPRQEVPWFTHPCFSASVAM